MPALNLEGIQHKRRERRKLPESSLEHLLPQLERLGAVRVVFFGSLAEDKVNSGSDLDILVVMPPERSGREWSCFIHDKPDRDVASDILVFNSIELETEIRINPFLRQITEKGRSLPEKGC